MLFHLGAQKFDVPRMLFHMGAQKAMSRVCPRLRPSEGGMRVASHVEIKPCRASEKMFHNPPFEHQLVSQDNLDP